LQCAQSGRMGRGPLRRRASRKYGLHRGRIGNRRKDAAFSANIAERVALKQSELELGVGIHVRFDAEALDDFGRIEAYFLVMLLND
jgi:hypothetical protein